MGLYATTYLLPVFLQSAWGHAAYETGMSLLPSALLSALLSAVSFVIAGPLSQKTDARALLVVGAASFIAGSYGLSHLTSRTGTRDVFWPLLWCGLSLGFLFIPMTVASLGGLKPSEIGEESASAGSRHCCPTGRISTGRCCRIMSIVAAPPCRTSSTGHRQRWQRTATRLRMPRRGRWAA